MFLDSPGCGSVGKTLALQMLRPELKSPSPTIMLGGGLPIVPALGILWGNVIN